MNHINAQNSKNTQGNHNANNQPTFGQSSADAYAEKLASQLAQRYPDEFAPVTTGVSYVNQ